MDTGNGDPVKSTGDPVDRTQRGATNEEIRKQKEEERINQRVQDFETNVEISEDASKTRGGMKLQDARSIIEGGTSYSELTQDQINKLARTAKNPATPSRIRKQIQGYLDSGKNPGGEKPDEYPVDAFTRNYFKDKGITNPTEADYRVAAHMFQRSQRNK